MDITYYTFAFFVFILLVILIWFYGRVTRGKKKEDDGGNERDQRLFRLYQNIEDMMGSFEEYAEEAKKEIGQGLEKLGAMVSETSRTQTQPVRQPESNKRPEKPAVRLQDESNLKIEDRIALLAARGLGKGEIAKELGLSIREVSLIMDIKKISAMDN